MNRKYFTYALIAIVPFLAIVVMILVNLNSVQHLDNQVSLEVVSWRTPGLSSFFGAVTTLANPMTVVATVVILAIVAFAITKRYHLSLWIILTNAIGSLAVNPLMKQLFQRSRPDESLRLVEETSYSFPSGHSFSSMVAFGTVIVMLIVFMEFGLFRRVLIFLCLAIIGFIGFSRIFLGVHYLTDVIGGFSLGLFWLLFCLSIFIPRLPSVEIKE